MRRLLWAVAVAFLLGSALAGGGGGGEGGTAPSDPAPSDPAPSSSQYRAAIVANAVSDGSYDVWACSQPSLATYTTARGLVATGSSPHKSSYMAHNARLYVDGTLVARSPDVVKRVSGASETNYLTSIAPATVAHRLSCPQALVAAITARGWHKAISIYGYSVTLYTSDVTYG
ncbi:MAG: hypothetical protein P1P87_09340 [Trueperaceae bacterium]|nr:hypothetical protein [Trueperaceae bacterium]